MFAVRVPVNVIRQALTILSAALLMKDDSGRKVPLIPVIMSCNFLSIEGSATDFSFFLAYDSCISFTNAGMSCSVGFDKGRIGMVFVYNMLRFGWSLGPTNTQPGLSFFKP